MAIPEVMSIRELRAQISSVVHTASRGTEVFIGPYRQPEAVIMSVRRYRELTGHDQAADPLEDRGPGGQELPALEAEVLAARQLARGQIGYHQYLQRLGRNTGDWS